MPGRISGKVYMETRTLELWCAYPVDLLDDGVAEACADLLSEQEQARWQRFRYEANRRESLTSRALARISLSHMHPTNPPTQWDFTVNAYGKPQAVPECGVHFNLSNTPGLVVCLLAEGAQVGVDAEPHSRAAQIAKLADDLFSPAEQAQLMTLHGEKKIDRALSLWTLKEAYIKGRGLGLSLPLKYISFLFGGQAGVSLRLDPPIGDDPSRWQFGLLDYAGHRVALMVEQTSSWKLRVLEARPVLNPPIIIHPGVLGWFPWA
jgi:4'-phosphopantetheinyl transferase